MVVVCIVLSSWAIVYFFMGDCFVEKTLDLIAFISACNQSFEKTFVHLSLSFSQEQRVKIQNSVLYMIPVAALVGGQNVGGCIDVS